MYSGDESFSVCLYNFSKDLSALFLVSSGFDLTSTSIVTLGFLTSGVLYAVAYKRIYEPYFYVRTVLTKPTLKSNGCRETTNSYIDILYKVIYIIICFTN